MGDRRRHAAMALPVAAVLFLVSGPIVGATYDDEEYRNAIMGLVLHARALLDGVYPYWTSSLGFGLPHPLHPAPILHPLMLLFGLVAPDTASRVLYVAHAILGAAGCWQLVRHLGGRPWAAALASATWALSTPSQNYVLTDFWPSVFVVWSLAPYLLLTAIRLLDAPPGARRWIDAMAFGLVAGLMWANGHAGYVAVFFVPLAVVFAAQWRRAVERWPALALAIGVGLALAAPTLAHLLTEVSRFPTLPRLTGYVRVETAQLFDMVLRPLSFRWPSEMLSAVLAHGTRIPFFGGPLFLLAVAYVCGLGGATPYRRSLVLGFLASFALMLAPLVERVEVFSSVYFFRDPMVLFGIVMGSLAWQTLAHRFPRTATTAAVAQVLVLFVSAWPFVNRTLAGREFIAPILHGTSTTAALETWRDHLPGRWYLAPELETAMLNHRLIPDGLWLNTWLYSGLPVVNGTFKGVSADDIYPSESLPIGRIRSHPSSVSSASTLSVLGVGVVLATSSEPVAPTLNEVARIATHDSGDLRVMRNPEVWPGAAFVDAAALSTPLETLPGCTVGGVLCLDLSPLASARHETAVHVRRRHGEIDVTFGADSRASRWLLVSEMHRPAWTARADGLRLPVTRVVNGLMAVQVPAGVNEIALRYRPTLLIALTWISGAAALLVTATLLVAAGTRRSPPTRYLYRALGRYVGYHLPPDARVVEVAPRTSLLAESLTGVDTRVVFPLPDSAAPQASVLHGWDDVRAFQPDRIILNGTLHFERDIQALLEQLNAVCTTSTRVIIAYYSSLWRPALTLAWRFGLTTKGPEQNWVSPSDVSNLLRLTGFELITESQHILLPIEIPLISAFVNRWLAPLPVLRWFALVNVAVVRRAPKALESCPSVSVIVPCRNERGNISGIVDRVPQMGPADELIFVEDHSTDGTWEEIQAVVARYGDRRVRAIKHVKGRGKRDAVRTGFAAAAGDVLMILDADMTVPPEDLPKFYKALTSGLGEFINGSRLIYPMEREAMRFANIIGNKFFALAFSYLVGQPLKDTLCGTKVLTRQHYEQIAAARLYFGDFDPFGDFDLLFGAAKLGLRIVELPVRYRERTYGTTNIRRWSHGWLLLRMTAFAARKMKFI